MTNGEISNVYEHKPAANIKPQQLVILLHGLGANGQDLMGLAPLFSQDLPEAVFISPDAPFPCDMAPVGYQWFSLLDRDPDKILKGVQIAAPILDKFIVQSLEKYNISADRLVLLGFSQGTMMSLYVGPRYQEKIGGILGYSGALMGAEGLIQDPDEYHKFPIRLIHGEADNVVPVEAYQHARENLENAGFEVSGYTTPGLMHGIDQAGIESGSDFLKSIFM